MRTYRYQRRLHWSECDPAGIIFFPHYPRWMVEGLNELFLSLGVDPNGKVDAQTSRGIPCVGFSMKFSTPPHLHEMVTHEIAVTKLGRTSLTVRHRFLRGEDVLAEAEDTRVWASHSLSDAGLKAEPIPDDLRAMLENG